jgi:hypothetical protein
MTTKLSLAALAIAAGLLAMPANAHATFDRGWRCNMFGAVKKRYKKSYAKRSAKRAKRV